LVKYKDMLIKSLKFTIIFSLLFAILNIPPIYATGLNFKPQIDIGGEFTKGANVTISNSTQTIGEYIKQIYKYAIGVVAIIAVVVMMIGGVLWITASGNPSQVGSAQQYISGALTGLVLVMSSYVILRTINPDLVNLKVHSINTVTIASSSNMIAGCCCDRAETAQREGYFKCIDVKTAQDCDTRVNDYKENVTCSKVEGCPQYGSVGCCCDTTATSLRDGYFGCTDVKSASDCPISRSFIYKTGLTCSQVEGCPQYPD